MCLESGSSSTNAEEIQLFSEQILQLGDGKISESNDENAEITISHELLLKNYMDPIEKIVTNT